MHHGAQRQVEQKDIQKNMQRMAQGRRQNRLPRLVVVTIHIF